ncbi:MAG: hypothetical protein D6795_05790 [Deltaproteobacteria bacterium]|nr:MAG: hypothetical protein D6795_05790 [Deltaproteobacteria bacterium]
MEKRRLAFGIDLLAALLILTTTACGGGNGGETSSAKTTGSEVTSGTAMENETTAQSGGMGGTTILTDGTGGAQVTSAGSQSAETTAGTENAQTTAGTEIPEISETLALANASARDDHTIALRFTVPIDPDSGSDPAHYVVLGSNGLVPEIQEVALSENRRIVLLTVDPPLPAGEGIDYRVTVNGILDENGDLISRQRNSRLLKSTLYVNIVWHQHQPLYLDPERDELRGPWVRKHAQKDYFDMTALVGRYPKIHLNVNLTSVLLHQLQHYYVDRLGPYVDVENDRVDEAAFLERWRGKTDPWIDLLLEDTPTPETATEEQLDILYRNIWSCFSISEVMLARFPEYEALRDKKNADPGSLTQEDFLKAKNFFEIAWFDPDFLRGPVAMPDGSVVDLSDIVAERSDGTFEFVVPMTEELANRLVAEDFKVMKNVVEIHRRLMYKTAANGGPSGQVEVITTPFFHPILPLLFDTDLARVAQPSDPMPANRFQWPGDAAAQVAKAVKFYEETFGQAPTGMWPAEGAVAEEIVPILVENGISWVATDQAVLERSTPEGVENPLYQPYRIDAGTEVGDEGKGALAIVFRERNLSDRIGFFYQGGTPQENATDFLAGLVSYAPNYGAGDRLLSVILDGENAWEWYSEDNDAKGFLNLLYTRLSESFDTREFVTVTTSEYLEGNEARGVAPHPIGTLPELEPLWPGSWINGNYDTWIGEPEENLAWDYLYRARSDLASTGFPRPDPMADPPEDLESPEGYVYQAWEAMYAAEGSDWFWWYGADQTAVGDDDSPFDNAFRTLLTAVYTFANLAGANLTVPSFPPILQPKPQDPAGPFPTPPVIDGTFSPDESEWSQGGGFFADNDSAGPDPAPGDDIETVFFGYDAERFYLAVRGKIDLRDLGGIAIYTSHKHLEEGGSTADPANPTTRNGTPLNFIAGGAAREITVTFSPAVLVALAFADGEGKWNSVESQGIAAISETDGRIVELSIPFADLGMVMGDPLEFAVVTFAAGEDRDLAPNANSKVLFPDPENFIEVTFEVDCTGERIPIDRYVDIANPPPPAGTGRAFIVGNRDNLGNWTPNTIALYDDGTHGDATPGDNLWTGRFFFSPLTEVQYKYTIGSEGEGWANTEEFPLTNRGFTVNDRNGDKKMWIRDIFADRPDPSGTLGPNTEIVNE